LQTPPHYPMSVSVVFYLPNFMVDHFHKQVLQNLSCRSTSDKGFYFNNSMRTRFPLGITASHDESGVSNVECASSHIPILAPPRHGTCKVQGTSSGINIVTCRLVFLWTTGKHVMFLLQFRHARLYMIANTIQTKQHPSTCRGDASS